MAITPHCLPDQLEQKMARRKGCDSVMENYEKGGRQMRLFILLDVCAALDE